MKKYMKLSVDRTAYYSGATYYEEVFLPLSVWEEIEDEIDLKVCLGELDGKHSDVSGEIEVELFDENELKSYIATNNDGENLFEHVYEYLDVDKYDNSWLLSIQDEVDAYNQVETITFKINKKDKDLIIDLVHPYLV